MNLKYNKLIPLLVVAGLLFLLTLATWPPCACAFEGSGLCEDGENVVGFDLDLPKDIDPIREQRCSYGSGAE